MSVGGHGIGRLHYGCPFEAVRWVWCGMPRSLRLVFSVPCVPQPWPQLQNVFNSLVRGGVTADACVQTALGAVFEVFSACAVVCAKGRCALAVIAVGSGTSTRLVVVPLWW